MGVCVWGGCGPANDRLCMFCVCLYMRMCVSAGVYVCLRVSVHAGVCGGGGVRGEG